MSDQADHITALRETNKFIDELMESELNAGAAYSGMLTAAIYRLLKGSTDKQDVTGILGAAMASASAHVEMNDEIISDIH